MRRRPLRASRDAEWPLVYQGSIAPATAGNYSSGKKVIWLIVVN